ncbi:S8 family peptidase [Sphingobacterium arenae]|uniref:S8 family peptidase n=1 Tax=Sphingobacterium arenae TaxID=1280598 RepID=A0ABR7Y455_9SPHI|nr:S8 family peptidase [Sphingobacterium arenae]MBD1426083.1 S8 family peptidase [Sphingobacterium arenae]
MKYNYGFGDKEDDDGHTNDRNDSVAIGKNLRSSYVKFGKDRNQRLSNRNNSLDVPMHIDYIRINFWGQFAVHDYFAKWYEQFGLEVVEVSNFGTTILFAVTETDKFSNFLQSIESVIKNADDHAGRSYSKLIHYIQDFELLTTSDIVLTTDKEGVFIFKLADLMVHNNGLEAILVKLEDYLQQRAITHIINREIGIVEIYSTDALDLTEIVNNFDIVLQVTSGRATLIKPSVFNIPQRDYGFEVADMPNLPLVGIIDSGISINTPLAKLIVVDERLNLTTTSVIEDNVDRGRGHGTTVAALAALGSEAVLREYRGVLTPDCQLLPIKITDAASSFISIARVLEILREAKRSYPQIKIFTLTINFSQNRKYNEHYSSYAYALDKFSFENDCLVFISSGNNANAILRTNGYDLRYFENEEANLCSPAESLNNVTVGACADSLRHGDYVGISNGKEYPTIYSRKGHYRYELLKKKAKINKTLFKPDLVMAGGDYCYRNNSLTDIGEGSMLLLSADSTESFYQSIGTSFATPLAANAAVRIQKRYPDLLASSIKALMLNHCSDKLVEELKENKKMLIGHGCLNGNDVLYSDSNRINFIVEDIIDSGELKIIPLNFPEYLITEKLGKTHGLLKVTATLCYQFLPVKDSQLGYCPVLIGFGFFRNHLGNDILKKEEEVKSKLKGSLTLWSQNCRFKEKPNPFSNVQKISFVVNAKELIDESGVFKIGIHCLTHPQLRPGEDVSYKKDNKFSIAIAVEETVNKKKVTGRLYDEMIAINEVENILTADQDLEAEAS